MYDLTMKCDGISRGTLACPQLFGNPKTKSVNVTLPKCLKVGQEVEKLTEKILHLESENLVKKKVSNSVVTGSEFEDQIGKSLGVNVMNGIVQM